MSEIAVSISGAKSDAAVLRRIIKTVPDLSPISESAISAAADLLEELIDAAESDCEATVSFQP